MAALSSKLGRDVVVGTEMRECNKRMREIKEGKDEDTK
jgi:hypothetical protein